MTDKKWSRIKHTAAIQTADQVVFYDRCLQADVQAAVDDQAENFSHDEAMHMMDKEIAAQPIGRNGRT